MTTFHRINDTYFTTATILKWHNLLRQDYFKEIIMVALSHLVKTGRVRVYAFVRMPNHIHLLWSLTGTCSLSQLKQALHSYTGHRFLQALKSNNNPHIKAYIVNKRDRKYQFWKRRSFAILHYRTDEPRVVR